MSFQYLRKIWEGRKSCQGGCFTNSSHSVKAQKPEVQEVGFVLENAHDEGADEVSDEGTLHDKFKLLPEDLVERILAMVPFPQVCKARVLSKSWQARFSAIESHKDEGDKLLASSFQRQAHERSINWRPHSPLFIDLKARERCFNWRPIDKGPSPVSIDLNNHPFYAYDWASRRLSKMPSLSFLPRAVLHDVVPKLEVLELTRRVLRLDHDKCLQLADGALLLVATVIREETYHLFRQRYISLELHVANLFTQTWKRLPQAPWERGDLVAHVKLVTQPALQKYKVINFYFWSGNCFAHCYDSRSNSWRKTASVHIFGDVSIPSNDLDGVLCMKGGFVWTEILAFNVEEETFTEIKLKGVRSWWSYKVKLVVCNRNLLMIAKDRQSQRCVQVLKLDLRSLQVSKLSRGPPAALLRGCCIVNPECFSDGVTSLCFRLSGTQLYSQEVEFETDAMMVYNMRTCLWHYVPLRGTSWLVSSFQTNCNPFLAV